MAKYRLVCRHGFGYSGYQNCSLWVVGEGGNENVSGEVAGLVNAIQASLGEPPTLLIDRPAHSFFIESGESFTLGDVAELLRLALGGEAVIETQDGGEETTLKVGGEPFLCPNCGSDTFRICGVGRYKCKCGQFLDNQPPEGDNAEGSA